MSLSHRSHRWIASIALVSYLLAATVSGMFHNHGENGHGDGCCVAGKCATERTSKGSSCTHAHRHHHADGSAGHKAHRHDVAEQKSAAANSTGPGRNSDRQPEQGHHGPLRHSDCAACQFLAQQSITTPRCELVATTLVAPHASDAAAPHVTTVVADAHPARGPPTQA
jgi:hypothetical protein